MTVSNTAGERITKALELVDHKQRATAQRRFAITAHPGDPAENAIDATIIAPCEPLSARVAPEYEVVYRLPFELERLLEVSPDSPPLPGGPIHLACVPIRAGLLSLAADLRFRQRWAFQRLGLGDISSSISLAPAEELTLTIRKTQRTQFTETTIRSSESLDSSESSVVDKDVLNVARASSQTNQWRVDSNASFSLAGVFSLGASGGLNGSVSSSSNSTVENITEATQKSARRLQTLQKIEVARQTELTLEDVHKRTITNPYRDRSLTLNVYELNKRYHVTTELAEIRPVLVLEVTDLEFGRDFVLSQGDFLDEALLDRTLGTELHDALRAARTPISSSHRDQARGFARMAFHILFEATDVFNLDGGRVEENDPWQSFVDDSAFEDALEYQAGNVFLTLGAYLRLHVALYRPLGVAGVGGLPPQNWRGALGAGHDREVALAIALADSIRTDWATLTPDKQADALDIDEKSEVLRRVPGFLSIVDNLVKPLLAPAEEEAAAVEASRRADDLIERVVAHLRCNRAHYVERFLAHLSQKTHGHALADLLVRMLSRVQVPAFPATTLLQLFNPRGGFLDGFQVIVPMNIGVNTSVATAMIEELAGVPQSLRETLELEPQTVNLVIPADGFHIEPVAGGCVLRDVPDQRTSVSTSIQVEAKG